MPDEDELLFRRLFDEISYELDPVGLLEELLVDQIASSVWRLRRLVQVEAGLFIRELYDDAATRAHRDAEQILNAAAILPPALAETVPNAPRSSDAEAYGIARERARAAEQIRDGSEGRMGNAFARDADGANAFSRLSRYETQIQRFLYQSLEKLIALQQKRLQDTLFTGAAEERRSRLVI